MVKRSVRRTRILTQQQEGRLAALQKKRAALAVELQSVQQRHDQIVQKVAERQAALEVCLEQQETSEAAAAATKENKQ